MTLSELLPPPTRPQAQSPGEPVSLSCDTVLTPGPGSLWWGPNQICRPCRDNQLLPAGARKPGSRREAQEGDTGPHYGTHDKVLGQELAASHCHSVPGESSSYRRCQVQGQPFGEERERNKSPIKRAPRGFSSIQNARG